MVDWNHQPCSIPTNEMQIYFQGGAALQCLLVLVLALEWCCFLSVQGEGVTGNLSLSLL